MNFIQVIHALHSHFSHPEAAIKQFASLILSLILSLRQWSLRLCPRWIPSNGAGQANEVCTSAIQTSKCSRQLVMTKHVPFISIRKRKSRLQFRLLEQTVMHLSSIIGSDVLRKSCGAFSKEGEFSQTLQCRTQQRKLLSIGLPIDLSSRSNRNRNILATVYRRVDLRKSSRPRACFWSRKRDKMAGTNTSDS